MQYTVKFAPNGTTHNIKVDTDGYVKRFDDAAVLIDEQAFNISDFWSVQKSERFSLYYNQKEYEFDTLNDAWDWFVTSYNDPRYLEFDTDAEASEFWGYTPQPLYV